MSRTTEKQRCRQQIWAKYLHEFRQKGRNHVNTERWFRIHKGFSQQRYMISRISVPKSNWASEILPKYSEPRWRVMTRMDPQSFKAILHLIQDNPIFQNRSSSPQAPVEIQLKVALFKLGHDGSASGFVPGSNQLGVSEGHISNCMHRVIHALFQLRNKYLYITWPTSSERRLESPENQMRKGLTGAIGKVDGSDIVLLYKPGGDLIGEHYYTRKNQYSIDLCAVCNSSKKFIYAITGYPGATHDARVWGLTQIHQNPSRYFSSGEYLL